MDTLTVVKTVKLFSPPKTHPTTIVTMLFDLVGGKGILHYLEHGKYVLEVDANMVIFCDEETYPHIKEVRGERSTEYVIRALSDHDYYKELLPVVRENRKTIPSPDPRNTPQYALLSVFKFYALKKAQAFFSEESTHYAWVDIGARHVLRGIPEALTPILDSPRDKVACCYIHYRSHEELYPIQKYMRKGNKCGIAAGIITVEREYVDRLYCSIFALLYEQIALGVLHAEEQLLTYCFDKHPSWFSLYFGDYYSLATNYHSSKEDKACIRRNFVQNAQLAKRKDLARQALESLA